MLTKKVARWIGVALVGGLLTAALAGCGGGAKQDANVIKLGANLEMTGNNATSDNQLLMEPNWRLRKLTLKAASTASSWNS